MSHAVGIDVGSRSIEVVIVEGGQVRFLAEEETTYDPLGQCRRLLSGLEAAVSLATGYGRHLLARHLGLAVVTEIKAHAAAAAALFPGCRTVLDIGGQDTKVIALDPSSRVLRFEMNDRCAAGTGRFLEVMAAALGFTLEEFAACAGRATEGVAISSMCTVFAASEVTGMLAAGRAREMVARGLHQSVAERSAAMLRRLSVEPEVVFCGGVARNRCLVELLEAELGQVVAVPERPQFMGALGAALLAGRMNG
jgi:predicted CoA-substrate-specific enzyme activase